MHESENLPMVGMKALFTAMEVLCGSLALAAVMYCKRSSPVKMGRPNKALSAVNLAESVSAGPPNTGRVCAGAAANIL